MRNKPCRTCKPAGWSVIITPQGTVLVARPLYRHLERKLAPDEWGLLRNYDWWTHLSGATALISISPKDAKR